MTVHAWVRRARLPEQQDLADRWEHCSLDPGRLAALGGRPGCQVRITRSAREYALYTVSEVRPEAPDTVVRMGRWGRVRLGTRDEFDAVLETAVARSDLDDDEARRRGELVERLHDDGRQRRLVVLAPHGGDIEPGTDAQAEHVAARLPADRASVWLCRGFGGERAARRWHITSSDVDPGSFPALGAVFGRGFGHAVSFHGFTRPEEAAAVVVGGAHERLRDRIAAAVRDELAGTGLVVRLGRPGEPLAGTSPANIVNRIAAGGGVQIEQSRVVRDRHAAAVAEAVARVCTAET